jgi:hypothetical protein
MVKKIKSSKRSKLPYIIGAVIILAIAGSIYAYHVDHKKKPPIATVDQYTKGQASKTSSPSSSSNQTTSPNQAVSSPSNTKTGSTTVSTSAPLVAPTGNFVSDHHPNLSGSPAPNSMTSVCNTSPGASCQITFTSGSTTKSLPTQVTDAGGATYWYWTLQDIGLTAGSWQVSATSSMNGNSLTSTDPMALVVSQ